MGTQHMPEQLKKGPTEALRAVFAGIGRMFLAIERAPDHGAHTSTLPRAQVAARTRAASGRHERPHGLASSQTDSRWRSLDKTGNVRLLSADDLADDYPDYVAKGRPAPADPALSAPTLASSMLTEPVEAEPVEAEPGEAEPLEASPRSAVAHLAAASAEVRITVDELPMSDYDRSSLASIRARLRGLDAAQLRTLLDYERANAERPEVLGMFERRISKLEAGG
jgi:hypothetical protein